MTDLAWLQYEARRETCLTLITPSGVPHPKVASDALGNLTRDVGMGIEEGTVAALISRSLEGPGDMDADDDVMGSSYVAPGVSPPCIGGHGPDGGSSGENASYEVQPKMGSDIDLVC